MGVHGLMIQIGVTGLLALFIPTCTYGIHLLTRRQPQRRVGGCLLGLSLVLAFLLYNVMAAGPRFDFIERCRPNGEGGCGSGRQTPAEVQIAIDNGLLVGVLLCVALPALAGTSVLFVILRRVDNPDNIENERRITQS